MSAGEELCPSASIKDYHWSLHRSRRSSRRSLVQQAQGPLDAVLLHGGFDLLAQFAQDRVDAVGAAAIAAGRCWQRSSFGLRCNL